MTGAHIHLVHPLQPPALPSTRRFPGLLREVRRAVLARPDSGSLVADIVLNPGTRSTAGHGTTGIMSKSKKSGLAVGTSNEANCMILNDYLPGTGSGWTDSGRPGQRETSLAR